MNRARLLVAVGLASCGIGASLPASARNDLPLAFMRTGDYRALEHREKVSRAEDFMRSFCGSLTMPVGAFVSCVDRRTAGESAGQPIFDDLKTCVRALS